MDLTVVDQAGIKSEEVSVPDNVAVGRITGKLVELFQLLGGIALGGRLRTAESQHTHRRDQSGRTLSTPIQLQRTQHGPLNRSRWPFPGRARPEF